MRKGERSILRITKKFAFGRPGEVDKLRFPAGFSLSDVDKDRREKITTKNVIYDVTLIDWVHRMDLEANALVHKEFVTEAPKKEYELPNEEFDEVSYSATFWQDDHNEWVFTELAKQAYEKQQVTEEVDKTFEEVKRNVILESTKTH